MGLSIGNVTKKIQQALKPRQDPEAERRRMENERILDFEHRERMLAAEDLARAKVQREISQVRRGKAKHARSPWLWINRVQREISQVRRGKAKHARSPWLWINRVQREISQVRRGKDLGPAGRPVQKKKLFHELTGSSFIQDKPGPAKRKSGGGGEGNPLIDDLAEVGGGGSRGSNRRAPSQGGFGALLGMEERAPRQSATPRRRTKKKGSSGTTIIIKK